MKTLPLITSFDQLPLTLRMAHIAALYDLCIDTVRDKVEQGDTVAIPRPSFVRPYRWRKADVQRHYDHASVSDQRQAIAQQRRAKLKVSA